MSPTLAERELFHIGKAQATPDAVRMFDAASFVHLTAPELSPGGLVGIYGAYELARVQVPKDAIGVVTLIWQYLATPAGPVSRPALDLAGVEVSWSLVVEDQAPKARALRRIENLADPQPPSDGRLPPYGSFSDLRHPWGSAEKIKVFAPERTIVSLWARVWAPGAEIRTVGGRLLGYTQPGQSAHTVGNLVVGI